MGTLPKINRWFAERDGIIKSGISRNELSNQLFEFVSKDYSKGLLIINGVVDSVTYSKTLNIEEKIYHMSVRLLIIAKQQGWKIYKAYESI